MTKEQLIKSYQQRINNATDKKSEVAKIIRDIQGLVYTESKKPISNSDKIEILEALQKNALLEHVEIFAQSNDDYTELLQQTIQMLKGGK